MKHFLCHRRGLPDVTIGFFGGIGGCDGAAPSALAAAGSGLRMACSRFRRFSLRLRCSWLRLPPLAALGSLLLASAWLPGTSAFVACCAELAASRSDLAARTSVFVASRFGLAAHGFGLAACRADFVASRFGLAARASASLLAALSSPLLASAWLLPVLAFAACRAGFAASRFGFVAYGFGFVAYGFDFVASGFGFRRLPPPLPAPRKPTGRADHTHTSFTSKH